MRVSATAVIAALVLSSCLDFDAALSTCAQPGGRCEVDGGRLLPGVDAGTTDGGQMIDAGGEVVDAGRDAGGLEADAGSAVDAGPSDAGGGSSEDAGPLVDAGVTDAGVVDAGPGADGGPLGDAGVEPDASTPDAGQPDAGNPFDAGVPDAGCLNCTWSLRYTQQNHSPQTSVSAPGPGDVWFVGASTSFVHLANNVFTDQYIVGSHSVVLARGAPGAATVYLAGDFGSSGNRYIRTFKEPWDGGDGPGLIASWPFEDLDNVIAFFVMNGTVYAAGSTGDISLSVLKSEGDGGWQPVTPFDAGPAYGAWSDGTPGDYFLGIGGDNEVLHITPAASSPERFAMPASSYINAIDGRPGSGTWVVGSHDLIAVIEGSSISYRTTGLPNVNWRGVFVADGHSTVFLVGHSDDCPGRIARFRGTTLDTTCVGTSNLTAVHGTGPTDVWAVDHGGRLFHFGPP